MTCISALNDQVKADVMRANGTLVGSGRDKKAMEDELDIGGSGTSMSAALIKRSTANVLATRILITLTSSAISRHLVTTDWKAYTSIKIVSIVSATATIAAMIAYPTVANVRKR